MATEDIRDQLKDCPFCGENDIKIMKHRTNNGHGLEEWDYYSISCRNPECFKPHGSDIELDDVIKKWNNRGYIDEE